MAHAKPHIRRYMLLSSVYIWGVFPSRQSRKPVVLTAKFSNLQHCNIFNKESKRGAHQA